MLKSGVGIEMRTSLPIAPVSNMETQGSSSTARVNAKNNIKP